MTNAQTEARAIALKIATGVMGNMDAEHVERFGTKVIAAALAAKDANIKMLGEQMVIERLHGYELLERAERAEAQLAETNKALEEIADAKTELTNRHDYSRGWNDALFRVRQIARRAREAQGGE